MTVIPRLGIRSQILLIAFIPVAIITVILILLIYRGSITQGKLALDRQGQLLAAQLAANLEYALFSGAVEQIPDTVAAVMNPSTEILGTPIGTITIVDRNQQTVFEQKPEPSEPLVSAPALLSWLVPMEQQRSFQAPVYLAPLDIDATTTDKRRLLGSVQLEIPTAPIQHALLKQFLQELGLLVLTLSLALGLAAWLGWRLSNFIKAVADAVLRIKQGDFDVRFQRNATAEINTLQEGVRLAAEEISQGQQRLQQALSKVQAEHEQALSELRLQTAAAERANEAKSLFLAKVSHEMRTPLYSILGLTEQLQKNHPDDQDSHALQVMLLAIRTLRHSIDDILEFVQLESHHYQAAITSFDPWTELETLIETAEVLACRQGLYIDCIVENDVAAHLMGDPKAFRTIASNLLANALKFTNCGGIVIRLSLMPPRTETGIVLTVQDTGCGIPQDKHSEIFQPFEQIEGGLNRRYAGSGLGLSIVRKYCDQLGGTIVVESETGRGSVFTVELPFELKVTEKPAAKTILRALVIDERRSFCESLRCRLSALGFDVTTQNLALSQLRFMTPPEQKFDVVLMHNLGLANHVKMLLPQLQQWGHKLLNLVTVDQKAYDQCGVIKLWCGASRSAIAEVLQVYPSEKTEPINADLSGFQALLQDKRVLIVEDFDINRAIMAQQLSSYGVDVIEAEDADSAIQLVQQMAFELILMDVQMPGKDGIAAIREIRQLPVGKSIPIIGFTASADKPTHQRILAAGADSVLSKPMTEADLITAVYQTLQETRAWA